MHAAEHTPLPQLRWHALRAAACTCFARRAAAARVKAVPAALVGLMHARRGFVGASVLLLLPLQPAAVAPASCSESRRVERDAHECQLVLKLFIGRHQQRLRAFAILVAYRQAQAFLSVSEGWWHLRRGRSDGAGQPGGGSWGAAAAARSGEMKRRRSQLPCSQIQSKSVSETRSA